MGPSWGSFSVKLTPFLAQVGLGTVLEPTYLRKSDCSRNITFSYGFCSKLTPGWGQDRPKIAPRRVQDRLGSPFFHLDFSLRFLIVLGSALVPFWPPKWSPGGAAELVVIDAWAVQDNLGIVLVRSFFHLAIRDHFFGPHGCLLESFSAVFGLVLGRLGLSWARFWVLRIAFCNPTTLYAHQLINPSTHGLSALCNSGRRTARSD